MLRLYRGVVGKLCFLLLLFSLVANFTWAQSETATVSGQVVDASGLNIVGAQVKLVDIDRDISTSAATNTSGLYAFPSVKPGRYRMEVTAAGFKIVNITGITVNVQDHLEQNFRLVVGSVSESITVESGAPSVDTEGGSVSTMVDRNFAENLPMNGRSFQTLIQLTPGVVLAPVSAEDSGQFSVNGQRASSNYWMVDGVSANIGIGSSNSSAAGNGLAGAAASFSVLGGTNSLVSVDAMQEFRIQTSTYAPEFGRTPGAQISILTRSGTNHFHGTIFEYLRNDLLDSNNWFADASSLPKARERQNDFGGTLDGPILRDRTFFFFSYEELRLRLPQTTLTTVPCDATCKSSGNVRSEAVPTMQPFLNAFPLPNGTDHGDGTADFNASYSNPASLEASSLRIDHKFRERLSVFGRYNYSPSMIVLRGNGDSLSTLFSKRIITETATGGGTWLISPTTANEMRFNYSTTNNNGYAYLDSFGGAVPLASPPLPSPFTIQTGALFVYVPSLNPLNTGPQGHNLQNQINVVDNLSRQKGSHSLKFGIDFRRLSPVYGNPGYSQEAVFLDIPLFETGSAFLWSVTSSRNRVPFGFHNLGAFAQDAWRMFSRLTLTYGIRWDVDFAPSSTPSLLAVTGFDLNNLSTLALAPAGTPAFKTRYANFAPRIGVAYQIRQSQDWQTVLRGGFGVFYDLATSEVGNNISPSSYPLGAFNGGLDSSYPLSPSQAAPPAITSAGLSSGNLYAFDPNLELPYTLQWNVALEQGLDKVQTFSMSYVGSVGRRLIQSAQISTPNLAFGAVDLVTNAAVSNYEALQLRFQRRLSHGLQALGSYSWAHSIDTASAGSLYGDQSNDLVPGLNPNINRGSSSFDIRNSFSAGVTYDIPVSEMNTPMKAILRGWSVENVWQAHSALPADVYDGGIFSLSTGAVAFIRPNVVPGHPLYLYKAQCASTFQQLLELSSEEMCPGGRGFNPAAFSPPPTDANGNALQQGDLARNALRGFGAFQWDFAVHRNFLIGDSLKLQFRAEMFNLLNHPMFGPPVSDTSAAEFGISTQTLGQYLAGGSVGNGGFNSLYQIGGSRSIQFGLKLQF